MTVCPSNIALIGVKLWENAFQTISDISFFAAKFFFGVFFFQESCVWEELGIFERHWQMPRRKSLPVVCSFSLYNPWQRGKSGTDRFCS